MGALLSSTSKLQQCSQVSSNKVVTTGTFTSACFPMKPTQSMPTHENIHRLRYDVGDF